MLYPWYRQREKIQNVVSVVQTEGKDIECCIRGTDRGKRFRMLYPWYRQREKI